MGRSCIDIGAAVDQQDTPLSVGINGASGGRSTPLILPTITCPPTRIAPELPAEQNASASPLRTIFMPTTMDESFFVRIALTGGSSVSMTSVALTTSICSFLYVCFLILLIRLLPCRSGKSEYLPSTGLPSRHLPRSHPVRCRPHGIYCYLNHCVFSFYHL